MNELVFKELNLNLDIKVCTIEGEEINLTRNEFNLLEFLIKNKNKIHSRQEILNNVWDSKVSLRTVDTTMSRLRKKMKNLGKYLVTRLGFGYGILEGRFCHNLHNKSTCSKNSKYNIIHKMTCEFNN